MLDPQSPLRQPQAPLHEPPRAQPGCLNEDAALVDMVVALRAVDAEHLDLAAVGSSHVRLRAYIDAKLAGTIAALADRGRLDMLDREACAAERVRRSIARPVRRSPDGLSGPEIFIAQPFRLDRLLATRVFTLATDDQVVAWPLDTTIGYFEQRVATMRDLCRREAFGHSHSKLVDLEDALAAAGIAKQAGGWQQAAEAQLRRRAVPRQAAE